MLRARDVMKSDPLTVPPDAPFLEVQHLFVEAQIGGAPVVDAGGSVLGIVTSTDLLAAVDQVYDEDVDGEEERLEDLTALDIASRDPVWVAPDMPIDEVAAIMRAGGVHRVLVGDDGRMLGMLTTFDLLEAVKP